MDEEEIGRGACYLHGNFSANRLFQGFLHGCLVTPPRTAPFSTLTGTLTLPGSAGGVVPGFDGFTGGVVGPGVPGVPVPRVPRSRLSRPSWIRSSRKRCSLQIRNPPFNGRSLGRNGAYFFT